MLIIIFLISLFIFIRTLSYAIYEIKQNSNTIGGIATIVIAVLSLILPCLTVYIKGSY